MTARSLKRLLLRAAAAGALGAALTACGGGGGGNGNGGTGGTVTTGGGSTATPEDFFGSAFSTDFHAASNTQPAVPKDGDVIPLSLTTQPQTTL